MKSALGDAACDLSSFLGRNSGTTADWPIDIIARDVEHADKLCELLKNLDLELRKNGYNPEKAVKCT